MALLFSDAFFPPRSTCHRRRRDPFDVFFSDLFPVETAIPMKISKDEDALNLSVDVGAFKPEELEVNIVGDSIVVEGNHSSESESGSVERRFVQKFKIPDDVDPESIQSSLDANGKLSVLARTKKPESVQGEKRKIPIGFSK
uniref:Putative small heat shock protein n=1 Tax=Steinernema ceratophorum TaxID=172739 RepID=A0A8F2Z1H6_9BILA|nr:putative small heat shock protein [Steinernema ceratophorum]